jgi:hypothetical protein
VVDDAVSEVRLPEEYCEFAKINSFMNFSQNNGYDFTFEALADATYSAGAKGTNSDIIAIDMLEYIENCRENGQSFSSFCSVALKVTNSYDMNDLDLIEGAAKANMRFSKKMGKEITYSQAMDEIVSEPEVINLR